MRRITRTIRVPNPDYWTEERQRQTIEASGYEVEDFFPEDYGKKLPDDGGWIILTVSVHCGRLMPDETTKHIDVPHLSVWFAVPQVAGNGAIKVAIQTPDGEVCVWPHEYNLFDIGKFLEFSDEDGFNIHFLSENGAFDEQALFYLRSRGISKGEAQRMLLVNLKDPHYCYFTFADELRECFGEMTKRLGPKNHERRAAAHARKQSREGVSE